MTDSFHLRTIFTYKYTLKICVYLQCLQANVTEYLQHQNNKPY